MAPPGTSWCRNLRFGIAQLFLLFLSLFFAPVRSGLVNITVDDQLGDPTTGLIPEYSPNNGTWLAGSPTENCPTCHIVPSILDLTQIHAQTWHDTTYLPSEPPATITVHFAGSAVYVFNILPNTLPGTITSANISFSIDGEDVGTFTRSPDSSSTILYNQLVYRNTTLIDDAHTLIMTVGGDSKSLILFDYLLYTTQSNDTSSTSTPTSASTPSGSSPSRSLSSSTPVGAVVGATLGSIALLGVAVGVLFFRRRRTRSRATQMQVSPTNGAHGSNHEGRSGRSQREYRVRGEDSASFAQPMVSTAPISLLRLLDGAATHNLSDPASGVPIGPDSARPSLAIADAGSPSTADRSPKHRAELARRLETLQRTRSDLSSESPSDRSRSLVEVSSGNGAEAAIRALEAEIAQLRGMLVGLSARLADEPHREDSERLPAYAE